MLHLELVKCSVGLLVSYDLSLPFQRKERNSSSFSAILSQITTVSVLLFYVCHYFDWTWFSVTHPISQSWQQISVVASVYLVIYFYIISSKYMRNKINNLHGASSSWPWASYQIRKIASCALRRECWELFPCHRFQRKPLVSDPGMHHGTCVTHVPWCMSGIADLRWRGKRSRHSRRMRKLQVYVSGQRPISKQNYDTTLSDSQPRKHIYIYICEVSTIISVPSKVIMQHVSDRGPGSGQKPPRPECSTK